jgi:phage terminase large subunit GpA-like protein
MNPRLQQIWREAWRPPDRRPPWAWAEDNIRGIPYSPIPGRFRADNSPWLKEPLEALVDPTVRVITLLASVQSSKTTVAEVGLCYIIANLPGPTLWLDQTDEDARDQAESRMGLLFGECQAVTSLFPPNRHLNKTAIKQFTNGMTLWVLGAHNKTNLQRRSIRWLIGDECWRWPTGHMAEAEARVTAFGWLGKCLFMSQGGHADDDMTKRHQMTDQREWTFACPECQSRQPYQWDQIKWSADARTEQGWDYAAVRASTVMLCSACQAEFPDDDRTRKRLNQAGCYVRQNPSASPENVGFHWNALCAMSWGRLAELYLRAKQSAKLGDIEPLKIFYQKRLGQPWAEAYEDYSVDLTPSDYRLGEDWEKEAALDKSGHVLPAPYEASMASAKLRIITVDCQMDHVFVVARSWAADGSSRLLWHEKLISFDDVSSLAQRLEVHPSLVFVDAGYATYDVYRGCAARRWTALMGDARTTYQHRLPNGRKVWRFYSQKRKVALTPTLACSVFYWSNLNVKDVLARLRSGSGGPTWEVAGDASPDYLQQLESERRVKKADKYLWERIGKRANHYFDCEAMQVTSALMLKLLGGDRETGEE